MKNEKYNKLKVLIVDDMGAIRLTISSLLKLLGFTKIEQAENGDVGILKVREANEINDPFDFVLSDVNMPICDGIEFIKKMKLDSTSKEIPIVMISSENEVGIVMEAIEAGAINYILKPFNLETLQKKIKEIESKIL